MTLHGNPAVPPKGTTCAIVPVKTLADAKSRLASVLSPALRRRLVLAMLEDVLEALAAAPGVDRAIVITADRDVGDVARRKGAGSLDEGSASGLNAALSLGVVQGLRQGASRVLLIPADLPFATAAEIGEIIAASRGLEGPHAVIVPDREGGGTNALLLAPPHAVAPCFGPRSFDRHRAVAQSRGLAMRILRLGGMSLDMDEAADLALLAERAGDRPRYRFLRDAETILDGVAPNRVGVAES